MTKSDRVQAIIGSIIIGCSVAAFFWWGMHFAVFDSDIDWLGRPEQVALPILIVVAAFGAGYAIGGKNFGVRASLGLRWSS
jgi:NO-binding membrane sensor protein with MHYT domain